MVTIDFINANTTELWRKYNYNFNESCEPIVFTESSVSSESSEPKEILPITYNCSICVEDMTINNIITCDICKNSSCKDCFKRFILDNEYDSKCMHCMKKISREFIILNLDVDWLQNEYKEFRKKHLFNVEKGKFLETQAAATVYTKAKDIISKLPFNPISFEFKGNIHNFTKHTSQFNTFHNARMCIMDYGVGWEDHDFDKGVRVESVSIKKTIKCPNNICAGIIPITGEDELMCAMCYGTVCSKCREIFIGKEHKCNEDTIKTISELVDTTRSCPNCATLIFKIEGCDQMFCTQCHTTFSWNTSRIERGFMHNPHYLDWIRDLRMRQIEGDKEVPDVPPAPCLEYITYEKLITCFPLDIWKNSFESRKKIPYIENIYNDLPSTELYCLALRNFHTNILHVRSTAGNHANMVAVNNHSIRVLYMTNNMEEDDFKNEIEHREYEWHQNITLFYIYDMVFRSAGDIYHNLLLNNTIEKIKSTYIEMLKLIEYANKFLEKHDMVYKTKSMKFIKRPF